MTVGADACIRPLDPALPPNSPGEQCSPLRTTINKNTNRVILRCRPILRADASGRPYGNRRLHSAPEGSIGRGRKGVKKNAALLHFLAFAFSDHNFGVLRGEQPLSRGLRVAHERARFAGWRRSLCAAKRARSEVAGPFSVPFGVPKGTTGGSMTLIRVERRKVARNGSCLLKTPKIQFDNPPPFMV